MPDRTPDRMSGDLIPHTFTVHGRDGSTQRIASRAEHGHMADVHKALVALRPVSRVVCERPGAVDSLPGHDPAPGTITEVMADSPWGNPPQPADTHPVLVFYTGGAPQPMAIHAPTMLAARICSVISLLDLVDRVVFWLPEGRKVALRKGNRVPGDVPDRPGGAR